MKTKISFLHAWTTSSQAKKLSSEQLQAVQNDRLHNLLSYARANSPYYAQLYKDLPEDAPLHLLPKVNKRELMARFEDWLCDRSVKLDNLKEFLADAGNIGKEYLGKYLVCTTSGSTGVPAIFLYDRNSLNALDALAISRAVAYKGIMSKLVKAGGRSGAVYATGGHYLGVASVRHKQYKNPLKAKQFKVFSALSPLKEQVEGLNRFRPALLGGYPTALELLIPEQEAGRLHITPVLINTGGEYLSKELAAQLSKAFGCPVQSGYSCTEGGMIAFQCSEGHLHVNSDWVILEPVDMNGNQVPEGVLSDKLYLTNLANYVQPVIRYEVTDRVRLLPGTCPCGSILPRIEVEGRTDDILHFKGRNGDVSVLPLALYTVMKETPGVVRFQLIQQGANELMLKLETSLSRDAVARDVRKRLEAFLEAKGAEASIYLSDELPAPASSGKFRHVSRAI